MRLVVATILFSALTACSPAPVPPAPSADPSAAPTAASAAPRLVWSDEFEGKALDRSKWTVEVNADGGGNDELQHYTDRPANVRVEDGELVITSREERFTGDDGQTASRWPTSPAGTCSPSTGSRGGSISTWTASAT